MYLDMCFPREIENAKANKTPVVIVGGTVEYHGPGCAYGCDTLVAEGLVKKLAERKDIIIAPTIRYSPASYAVGDETSGTVHVEENAFEEYIEKKEFLFEIPYDIFDKVKHSIKDLHIQDIKEDFTSSIVISGKIYAYEAEVLTSILTNLTNGKTEVSIL